MILEKLIKVKNILSKEEKGLKDYLWRVNNYLIEVEETLEDVQRAKKDVNKRIVKAMKNGS